jgi:hypothetical protein
MAKDMSAPKCCNCKKPTPHPAHDTLVPKRYNGWAPGRYTTSRQVWCEACWAEFTRANQESHERFMAENARILEQANGAV